MPLFLAAVLSFLASAAGLIVEIVAGRMLAPYVGMSLYTWTAIIAVVLAGFSLGHWIGGERADKADNPVGRDLATAFVATGLSAIAALVLLRLLAPLLVEQPWPQALIIVLLSFGLFFAPSTFVGMISPILTTLAARGAAEEHRGRVIGLMYAANASGSILGALVAGFVMLSWLGVAGSLLGVGAAMIALGLLLAVKGRRTGKALTALLGVVITGGAILAAVGSTRGAFTSPCDVESDYYCLRFVDMTADIGTPAKLMVLDHLAHGINLRDEPQVLVSPYVEIMDQLVRSRFPGRTEAAAYFVGGGAYTLPRAWKDRWPGWGLTVSEIDPAVTRAVESDFWVETAGMEVLTRDARWALQNMASDRRFEVMVGDAFHDISIPPHLVTEEFLAAVKGRLTDDGLYLMNIVDSAPHTDGNLPDFLRAMIGTAKGVFPVVELWVDPAQFKGSGRVTYVLLCAATPSRMGGIRSVDTPGAVWVRLQDAAVTDSVDAAPVQRLTDDFAPIDRLIGWVNKS